MMNTRHILVVLALCTPMLGSAKVWMMECENSFYENRKELIRYDNERKVIESREFGKWVPLCAEGVESKYDLGPFKMTRTERAEYRPDSVTCRFNIVKRGGSESVETIRGYELYDFLTREHISDSITVE